VLLTLVSVAAVLPKMTSFFPAPPRNTAPPSMRVTALSTSSVAWADRVGALDLNACGARDHTEIGDATGETRRDDINADSTCRARPCVVDPAGETEPAIRTPEVAFARTAPPFLKPRARAIGQEVLASLR
jgi:hypothetical protein